MDQVKIFMNKYKKVTEQLKQIRKKTKTLNESERYTHEHWEAIFFLKREAEKVPDSHHRHIARAIKTVDSFADHYGKFCEYRLSYADAHKQDEIEINSIEASFPRRTGFRIGDIGIYADDFSFLTTFDIPERELSFRLNQAQASFLQQIESRCCLSAPTDEHRFYPRLTQLGLKIITRDKRDTFFDQKLDLRCACIYYMCTFVEETVQKNPNIPRPYLPLIKPIEEERVSETAAPSAAAPPAAAPPAAAVPEVD